MLAATVVAMPLGNANGRGRVLLTDAGERSMLAACRGLFAAGYAVSVAAYEPLAPTHWSLCCSERLRVADPRADAGQFVADLAGILGRRRYATLIADSDFSLFAISQARRQLEGLTRLGLPSHAVLSAALDREELARAARRAGLAVAPSVQCSDAASAVEAARQLGFPVVLKAPATFSVSGRGVASPPPTRRVVGEAALRQVVDEYGDTFLLQRAEPGATISFGGVIVGGRLLGVAVSRYERTWPPIAGNAAFSITISPAPELEAAVTAMLRDIGWEGIFEVELISAPEGRMVVIDLNPRPYGSMALAMRAGANLPALWCDWIIAGVAGSARAAAGHRYRWEDGDLRHLLWQLRSGQSRQARQTLRPRRHVVHPHFQARDPLPLLARGLSLAYRRLAR